MAITPQDSYIIMQDAVNQLMGINAPDTIDESNFLDVGQQIATFTQEKVFNAVNISLGNFVMAVRPIDEEFNILRSISTKEFNHRFRKISFYSKKTKPSGMFNTNLYTNHKTGYTAGTNNGNSTPSQWEQNLAIPLELNFGKSNTWQYCVTNLLIDGKYAFEDESEWIQFIEGYMTQHANDMKMEREAFNRMTFLGHVGVNYAAGTSAGGAASRGVKNLTAGFNEKFGTNYTSAQLRTSYLSDFLAYFVSEVKQDIKKMRKNNIFYHYYPIITENGESYHLPRHTPTRMQKMVLLDEFWTDAEAYVMPKVFNTEYLDKGNFETIEYWQSPVSPAEIDVTVPIPAWLNTIMSGVTASDTTANVNIPYFLGAIFDRDACMTDMQVERALTSGIESRKGFSNTWYTFAKSAISDPTEKMILYVMEDGPADLTITPTLDSVTLYDGKVASDLQSDVVITDNVISLKSKFIEGGLAESGPLAGDGYFMALTWSAPASGVTTLKVGVIPTQGTGLVDALSDPDRTVVVKLDNTQHQRFVIYTSDDETSNTQTFDLNVTFVE